MSNPDDQGQPGEFFPLEPNSLKETGLVITQLEELILKFLLNCGSASGRRIADQIKLPFGLVQEILRMLKSQMLVSYKAAALMSDYEYELSDAGFERGRRYFEQCTYYGAAPVSLEDYVESIRRQSIRNVRPRLADFCNAFADLILPPAVVSQVGQAVNSGQGLFLYGEPGNGKTSIAERLIKAASEPIWIPRTIAVTGALIRLYDPGSHEELPLKQQGQLLETTRIDKRWVRIRRPTIVVGGELTLQHLEVANNGLTGVHESPLQLKSNGGALVIDDFGRQRTSIRELLNRWIVPLEKGYDYLALPSGRQIQIPFDQLLAFATNLEPKDLVDEAFLRRIPYKIQIFDPTEKEFRDLFRRLAPEMGFKYEEEPLDYLIAKHYMAAGRPMRYCHVRDLLLQVKNFCEFHEQPLELTCRGLDVAVKNYFAGL